jgi:hypothetical protein
MSVHWHKNWKNDAIFYFNPQKNFRISPINKKSDESWRENYGKSKRI